MTLYNWRNEFTSTANFFSGLASRQFLSYRFGNVANNGYRDKIRSEYAKQGLIDLSLLRVNRAVQADFLKTHPTQSAHSRLVQGVGIVGKIKLADALDEMPLWVSKLLAETGVSAELGGDQYNNYVPFLRDIVVANSSSENIEGRPHGMGDTYAHEAGHPVDHLSGWLSQSDEFRASYKADITDLMKRLSADEKIEVSNGQSVDLAYYIERYCQHYLPKGKGGSYQDEPDARKETFAEIFADKVYRPRLGLADILPRTGALMDRIIHSLEWEMSQPIPTQSEIAQNVHSQQIMSDALTPNF